MDLIMFLAKNYQLQVVSYMLKPLKPSTMGKFVLGRIEQLQKLIETLGIVEGKESSGMTLEVTLVYIGIERFFNPLV
jgi:hypothetical protein